MAWGWPTIRLGLPDEADRMKTTRPETLVGRAGVAPTSVLGENRSQLGKIVGLEQRVGLVHLVEETEQLAG